MSTKDPVSGDSVTPVVLDPVEPTELPRRAVVLQLADADTRSPLAQLFDEVVLMGLDELSRRLPALDRDTCLAYTADDEVASRLGDLLAGPSVPATVVVAVDRQTTTGPTVPEGWAVRGRLVTDGVTALVLEREPGDGASWDEAARADEAALRRAVLGADGEPAHLLRDAAALAEAARARRSETRAAELEQKLAQAHAERDRARAQLDDLRGQRDQARAQLRGLENSPLGFLAVLSQQLQRRTLAGSGPAGRAPRFRVAASAGAALVAVLVVSVVVATATGSGYPGGAVTALAVLVVVDILLGIRGRRALARNLRDLATSGRTGVRAQKSRLDDLRRGTRELSRVAQQTAERQAAVQRQLEILAATSTDIAAVVRSLPGLPGGGAGQSVVREQLDGFACEQLFRGVGRAVAGAAPRLDTELHRVASSVVRQTQSLNDLYSLVEPRRPLPPLGGWAVAPDTMLLLVDELLQLRPRTVVECGSGSSTVWLALAVRRLGLPTRIVALEHLEQYRNETIELLTAHEVQDLAEVRLAPLADPGLPEHPTPWYARTALDGIEQVGLLFVDGPPASTGPLVRFPAVPLLGDRLAAEATIVLDDTIRPDETKIAELWADQLPDFEVEHPPLQKGAAVFRRRGRPSPAGNAG